MNDQEPSPAWLDTMLMAVHPSAAFRAACQQKASEAAAIYRLRLARHQLGPRPVSIRTWIEDLTRVADVSLQAVLAWAGLRLDGPTDPPFAAAWGRLAAGLRLDWREALLQLRLSLLEQTGTPIAFAGIRARGTARPSQDWLAESEQAVAAATIGWTEVQRAHLRACEEAARQAFGGENP